MLHRMQLRAALHEAGMRALAMQDGELFDDLLQQMREAHARSQADADAPREACAK